MLLLAKVCQNIEGLDQRVLLDLKITKGRGLENLKNCAAFKALLRSNKKISLILLNIDNFSNINDSFGVEYGDEIFTRIQDTLNQFKFPNIDIYKLESDEFALVNLNIASDNESIEIANQICSFFNTNEIELDEDIAVNISFSIGITSGKGLSVLNNARLVIRELREHTRGTYKVYDMKSPYIRAVQENVYWVHKIQESVAEDTIIPFFQPIINNETQEIEKYECLARIDNDGDFVSPYHFMSAAKETRVIPLITKSMIKQSCRMFSKSEYEFSINITNEDLELGYLQEYLVRNTKLFNIKPSRIVLELLEDISSLNKGTILKQLESLRSLGFKLAVDDFGSESSNFSRLLEFEADYLKIDGAFIKDILTDERSRIITKGIVSIVHQLGIKVIAEYIHSQEVQDKVNELGIDYSQGYLHGKPSRTLKDS